MTELAPATIRCCTTCRATYRADYARCPVDGGAIEEVDADPLVGETVANYTIEALIGQGGMGRVYRAHHARLEHRRFALKILLGDLAATMATRLRFSQEAEAASQLGHPNVVAVTDFGRTDGGMLYLAMELVEGPTLAELIEQGPMDPARVVALARQLAAGLEHAHDKGLVHRDFKPDNVLVVTEHGREVPRIVDFGLAIPADPTANQLRLTTVGMALGTPAYAAPEQTHLQPVDHRADLFALGITMFEMLAGTLPFSGSMLEVMQANASGVVPDIAAIAPTASVPPALEALVRALMSPRREARPASATEVIATLDRVFETPVVAPPPPPRTRRHLRAVALLGTAAAAVAAVALGTAVDAPSSSSSRAAPPPPQISATSAPVAAVAREVVVPAPERVPDALPAPAEIVAPGPPRAGSALARPVPAAKAPAPLARPALPASDPETPPPAVAEVAPPTVDVPVQSPPPPPPARAPASPVVPTQPPRDAPVATRAAVRFDQLVVRGALTSATVQRALDRTLAGVAACYGPAATRAARSPALALAIRFVIDENQLARSVRVAPAPLPGLTACATAALATVRPDTPPDVGVVDVSVVVRFTPEPAARR